ncbi:MAG TPA: hypothetical protein VLK84_21515 [Longimicrobium sp.]|nr:hypothetical protein [Longimicrobium sp.]
MLALRPSHRPLAGFALLAAAVYATALLAASSPLLARAPRLLSGAVTADLLVTVPLLYWFRVVRRTRVPAITIVPLIAIGAATAYLILPERYHGWLAVAALALPALAEAAVLATAVVRTRGMIRRMRAAPRAVDPFDTFRAALQATVRSRIVAHAIATEVALVWYALLSWRSKPRVGDGELAFTNDRRTGAAGLLFGLAVASLMEIPITHVLIAHENPPLAWGLSIAGGYSLLWMLGFARALRLHPVTLGADAMRVRVGLIWDVTVPYAAIGAVDDAPRQPVDRNARGYLYAAFAGTPQTLLTLDEPVDAHGIYGQRKRGVRRIGVYVDEPAAFRDALRARVAAAHGLPVETPAADGPVSDASALDEARRAWQARWHREG